MNDSRVSIGAGAGTTGLGLDAAWRLHDNFSVIAGYHGGLEWDGDHDTDEATYTGDIDLQAGSLKVAYHPFGGRFYLTAGAMLPDMEANVVGTAKDGQEYEYNGNTYDASDVGSLNGTLTIADGVQPYVGLGWRSSHERGLGFFSEVGVMSTDVEVSLSSSENFENNGTTEGDKFNADLRKEEQRLEDEADELSVYPVAMFGISYTF
ncbi:hypothetical protein [Halomonas sp.]|uniref:hypothetical protein n=1 Tax=Halomonas sp. TaxID=1486246 RepID=UPI00298E209D|nr:hypothetical protein [Halomonas sp.]MDW7748282.1 hypothetical protein [Halomonas sp.]